MKSKKKAASTRAAAGRKTALTKDTPETKMIRHGGRPIMAVHKLEIEILRLDQAFYAKQTSMYHRAVLRLMAIPGRDGMRYLARLKKIEAKYGLSAAVKP